MMSIFFLFTGCVIQELCMKDVQGEWVVEKATVRTDSCNATEIWEGYYNEPYTFRGSLRNALLGPLDCDFDGRASASFYCQDIFPEVYVRAWENDFLEQSTSPGGWAEACNGINAINIDGYTEGLVTAEDEIIVQFHGSAYCPSFDQTQELSCDVEVQWVLKPMTQQ